MNEQSNSPIEIYSRAIQKQVVRAVMSRKPTMIIQRSFLGFCVRGRSLCLTSDTSKKKLIKIQ